MFKFIEDQGQGSTCWYEKIKEFYGGLFEIFWGWVENRFLVVLNFPVILRGILKIMHAWISWGEFDTFEVYETEQLVSFELIVDVDYVRGWFSSLEAGFC